MKIIMSISACRRPAPCRVRLVTGALALLVGASFHAQQPPAAPADSQPPATFKAEVDYVEVDVVALDDQGRFVRDLSKADFQVLEDGRPQSIEIFSTVDIPVERPEQTLIPGDPIEPDVRTNAGGFRGRLYVLALDDLHTELHRSELVKRAARTFLDRHVGANDLVAVVQTSGRTDGAQEFTNNRRLLASAVDRFRGRKLRSATLERLDAQPGTVDLRNPGALPPDIRDPERGYDARSSLMVLRNLAEAVEGVHGRRKAIVFISEGIDYNVFDPIGTRFAADIQGETRATIAAAGRANVNIYSIDPRGLTALGDEVMQIRGLPENENYQLGPPSALDEVRLSQDSLRVLSDETGGFAVINSNDFTEAFERIVRENSSYYLLGYYPTNDRRDGRFRNIEVKVNRPGVSVRARKGYTASRGRQAEKRSPTKIPELNEVLASPVPSGGLTLSAFVAPFRGPASNASLVVSIEAVGRELTFARKGEMFEDVLDVSVIAMDSQGKYQASDHSTLTLGLKPDTHRRVVESGFRTMARVDLPPGRYQLRAAARESGGGRVGTVFYDIEVPNFSVPPLAMSGVVLVSVASAQVLTVRADVVKDILPTIPAVGREFRTADELVAFAEVYDNRASSPHVVDITTTLVANDGREVYRSAEERSTTELGGKSGGFGYVVRFPLKDYQPGLYVLQVHAQSRQDDRPAASRQVQLRIVP
jgi:VWFA-related protein